MNPIANTASNAARTNTTTKKPNQKRRNERERKRVHQVNHGFDVLRFHLMNHVTKKKLSKADTLREAVNYINHLQTMLASDGASTINQVMPTCSTPYYQAHPHDFDVYFPSESTSPQFSNSTTSNSTPVQDTSYQTYSQIKYIHPSP